MGGPNSGKSWSKPSKAVLDDYRSLDVRHFNRVGAFSHRRSGTVSWTRGGKDCGYAFYVANHDFLTLKYDYSLTGDEPQSLKMDIPITWTPCHLGGFRPWFVCPGCRRRVALLYESRTFHCRRCLNLTYRSQKESSVERAIRRAEKVREALGWRVGILHPDGGRPKGMHRRTFQALKQRQQHLHQQALYGLWKAANEIG